MCSGTIGMPATGMLRYSMFACGFLVVITSVVSSGAVTDLKLATNEPFDVAAVSLCMIRLNVQAASFAVNGWPSDHSRPGGILNVHVSLSGDVVHEWGRYGMGSPLLSSMVSAG